jgi:hypothetical protein
MNAFFWMMTAVTLKYIARGDAVFAVTWIEELSRIRDEVRRLLSDQPFQYRGGSRNVLNIDRHGQVQALLDLAQEMQSLQLDMAKLGSATPAAPMDTLDILFQLAEEKSWDQE